LSAKRQHLCDQFQRDTGTRAAVLSLTAANTGIDVTVPIFEALISFFFDIYRRHILEFTVYETCGNSRVKMKSIREECNKQYT
jgi:hypothetical protein